MNLDEKFHELGIRIFQKGNQLNVYYKSRKRDKFTVLVTLFGIVILPILPFTNLELPWSIVLLFEVLLIILGAIGTFYYLMPQFSLINGKLLVRSKYSWKTKSYDFPVKLEVLDEIQDFRTEKNAPKKIRIIGLVLKEEGQNKTLFFKKIHINNEKHVKKVKSLMNEFIQLLQNDKLNIELVR